MESFIQTYYLLPIIFGLFIAFIVFRFFINYVNPAKKINGSLEVITNFLKDLDKENFDFHLVEDQFNQTGFQAVWCNYKNSLHNIYVDIDGESRQVASKSTVPSEVIFTQSVLIDTPLKIEFYKHLPGLITGMGIIATFLGLIIGLQGFDPAGDPAKVQNSLNLLLGSVAEAFIASGIAILAAMLITWAEKYWLRTSYENLENLTFQIDRIFDTDHTGEEYLAKILQASKENETHARQLKDSLVSDLKTMMTNLIEENKKNQLDLTAQLNDGYAKASQNMADQIGQSISETLQTPLEKIASSVQQVSGDQSTAVQSLLSDTLSAFMSKLESTFGSQMQGMNEMMTQSVTAMKEMQIGFSQLITEMEVSSTNSAKSLEQQMSGMIEGIQVKQNQMSEQMANMVVGLSESASKIGEQGQNSVKQLNEKVSELMENMEITMTSVVENIAQTRIKQDQVIAENQAKIHTEASLFIENLSSEIKQLVLESKNATESYKNNIQKLTQVTTDSISGMNNGAEKIRLASDQFNAAGSSLITVTEKTSKLINEVTTTSTHLTSASSNIINLLNDYKSSQDIVNKAISTLNDLVKQAQSEAGLNTKMLGDMQQMTEALNQVKKEMQDYLEQVNDVLVKSFVTFESSVETSLNHSLGVYDNTLNQAVQRLATGVEGLGSFVEDLEDIVKNKRT